MHGTAARLPTHELRTGTSFPDWSAVSSLRAIDALRATLALYDPFRDRPKFTPDEGSVRQGLLRHYLATGTAPSRGTVRSATGLPEAAADAALARLHDRDLVVLDPDGGIVGAYPFTDRKTEHRVVIDGRTIGTMCAIDALGAGAMAGRDSVILSRCRECEAPLRVTTAEDGRKIGDTEPADPVVWIGRHYRDNCAADSLCMTMCFFCSEEHLEAWRAGRARPDGFRLSLAEGLELGHAVFEPALSGSSL